MKIFSLYKKFDGNIKACKCQEEQLGQMLGAGWSKDPEAPEAETQGGGHGVDPKKKDKKEKSDKKLK